MKIKVKTLKGKLHEIEAGEADTVAEVKAIIQASIDDLSNGALKLIHAGKILSDDSAIFKSLGIDENSFIVCMATKSKKPVDAPAETPSKVAAKENPPTKNAPLKSRVPVVPSSAASALPEQISNASSVAQSHSARPSTDSVSQLKDMGFPGNMVDAALQAADGNPDIAIEFLMSGIPEEPASMSQQSSQIRNDDREPRSLERLRQHPHFDSLRRLVQSNPRSLQLVLESIGEQDPELLNEIHTNQAQFIAMMNEPVSSEESVPSTSPNPSLGGIQNPAAFSQMLLNMTPEMQAQMAMSMGLSPEQLRLMAQVIGNTSPEQFQQMFGGIAPGGMSDFSNSSRGGGPQVVRLTEDESAAVSRLMELGFSQREAAQAYLACDKDESLAANYLMDNMADIREFDEPLQQNQNRRNNGGGDHHQSSSTGERSDESEDSGDGQKNA